jgi:hypothetical protein
MERGRVVECGQGLRWRVLFPDEEHLIVSGLLAGLGGFGL